MKNIILLTGISSLFILTACQSDRSEAASAYKDQHLITDDQERSELLDVSEDIFYTSDRTNESAEGTKTYIENRQEYLNLPNGRYKIYGSGGGNVEVYDSNDELIISDYIGNGYPPSLTVDLKDDYTVKVDGFYELFVEPTETKMKTELSSGIWEVGLDVPAGEYEVTAESGMGYLIIFDPNQNHQVYELIGNAYSSTSSTITLDKGQKLSITGVTRLILSELKE